jgi:hypothetical protein
MTDESRLLERTAEIASGYRASLATRPVGRPVDLVALRATLGGPLPDRPTDPLTVIEDRAAADPGLVASAGPRYFGFVIGGGLPAALAADWLASTWDQNAVLYVASPAAAVAEEVAAGWLVDLLGLPAGTSVGFVTGATMANFTAIAAARHAVLARVGWDVDRQGLQGAPLVTVITHEGSHVTVAASLGMLGLGREGDRVRRIASDDQGRMRPDALRAALAGIDGPAIVCAQAGNVNSGAFDPLDQIVSIANDRGAWVHVDGAFGIWAAAVPSLRHLMRGHAGADSWSTDAHKWLNVPYDSGLVFVRDAADHPKPTTLVAIYYLKNEGTQSDTYNRVTIVAPGARVHGPCRPPVAGAAWSGRPRRARLRAGPSDGRSARSGTRREDPQRGRAQPGARPLRAARRRCRRSGRRRTDPGRRRRGPARRDVLAGRDDVERSSGHAHLGVRMADDTRRHRPLGGCHPRLPRRGEPARRVTGSARGPRPPAGDRGP